MNDIAPNDPTKGWDGQFRDEMMNPGVYAYYAEVSFIDGIELVYVGDVTIVR
jgi:hypothetical protein